MADFEEKRYSIDPGPGKKMDGCPYSNFEDGHDVQDYIIPPKGYVFSGFRFDPDARNQIYDGKLYALYTKEPFNIRLKSNLWKFLLVFIIVAVVGLIILLAFSIFKKPSNTNETVKAPKTEVKTETVKKTEKKTDNSLIDKNENTTKTPSPTATTKPEEAMKTEVEQKPAEIIEQPQENTQAEANDPNVYFKQEFWALIHQRVATMDSYTDLYNNYKTKVSGEEFDYLRYTILKNYVSFKDWYDKLKKIPVDQLNSINTVNDLSRNINK